MSKLSKLLQVTEEEKKAILDHYDLTEEQFEENVKRLKDWMAQCEHLPKEGDGVYNEDNKFKISLLNSKMSMEKAKQAIEGYYRIRTLYANEMFDKLIPSSQEYQLSKRCVKIVCMPKLTPDLCRITIFQMSDPNAEATDAYIYEIVVLMMAELRIRNDMFLSNIIIIDYDGYKFRNLLKFTPSIQQKLVDILNSVNLRIKSIHFLNVPPFIDHLMRLLKALVPAKIVNKIHMHKTNEALWEHVPREYLPSNFGGTEKSVEELYDEWCDQIEESEEYFKYLLNEKSTKKYEFDPIQQDMYGIGVDGSFKQLTVD